MSRVQSTVEPAVASIEGIRRPMTIARKRIIHGAYDGRCGICRKPVPLTGPLVVYDHGPTIWIALRDENEDVWPLCADPCNKLKTRKDKGIIAHIDRIIRKAAGTWRPNRKPIPQRPNPWPAKSRLSHSTLKRTVSGKVVVR